METEQTLRRSERKIKRRREDSIKETFTIDAPVSKQWSRAEKSQLLEALQAFEETDIVSISQHIPTRSCQQIEAFIRNTKKKASMLCNKVPLISELEKWSKLLKSGKRGTDVSGYDPLTIPLFFISAFENLPQPTSCDGIDFKAAYEFIFCIMAEIPPRPLNNKTIDFISKTFNEMGAMVAENSDLKEYVKNKVNGSIGDSSKISADFLNPLNFPEMVIPLTMNSSG